MGAKLSSHGHDGEDYNYNCNSGDQNSIADMSCSNMPRRTLRRRNVSLILYIDMCL
jgi:hypothetical protein